jgi:hypothetical protein
MHCMSHAVKFLKYRLRDIHTFFLNYNHGNNIQCVEFSQVEMMQTLLHFMYQLAAVTLIASETSPLLMLLSIFFWGLDLLVFSDVQCVKILIFYLHK